MSARGPRRRPRRGAERAGAGAGAGAAVRVRRGRARPRQARHAGLATSAPSTSATSPRAVRCVNELRAPLPRRRGGARASKLEIAAGAPVPADRSPPPRPPRCARELMPDDNRVVLATAPEKAGAGGGDRGGAARRRSTRRRGGDGDAVARRDRRPRAAGQGAGAGLGPRPPRDSRDRRHRADPVERRRGLAEADRLPQRPDRRSPSYARGGTVAGAAGGLSQRLAGDRRWSASPGIGGFTPVDLGKLLAGKIANASAYISTTTHGISGGTTPRDLETALQLTYLQFTAPNRDPAAFELMKQRLEANLANQAQNPGAVFGERRAPHQHDGPLHRRGRCGSRTSPKLDADAHVWRSTSERFANAADFTFFIVGAFTVERDHPAARDLRRLAAVARHGDVEDRRAAACSSRRAACARRCTRGRSRAARR